MARCQHINHMRSSYPYVVGVTPKGHNRIENVPVVLGYSMTLRRQEICDEGFLPPVAATSKRLRRLSKETEDK